MRCKVSLALSPDAGLPERASAHMSTATSAQASCNAEQLYLHVRPVLFTGKDCFWSEYTIVCFSQHVALMQGSI